VTGPDEYTTVVNDNAFTNLMARANLRYAAEVVPWLRRRTPDAYEHLVHDTGLDPDEVERWQRSRRRDVRPLRRGARDPPAGRELPREGGLGLREHAEGPTTRCCCTTTRW
jgi:hypothetical protein